MPSSGGQVAFFRSSGGLLQVVKPSSGRQVVRRSSSKTLKLMHLMLANNLNGNKQPMPPTDLCTQ
eukprot:scaffold172637_cov25-Tisochrysis_lutea.AAC.1